MRTGSCAYRLARSLVAVVLPYLLVFTFCSLPAVGDQIIHVKRWRALGPFIIGKNELDGEPWHVANISELIGGGTVKWTNFQAGKDGGLTVEWGNNVNWQSLVDAVGGHELLEWQALLQGVFKTKAAGEALVTCQGISAFYVDNRVIPLVGDQYHSSVISQPLHLAAGNHKITVRLRAKVRGQLSCTVQLLDTVRPRIFGGKILALPDVVDGILASDLVTVPVLNPHSREWLTDPRLSQTEKSAVLAFASEQPEAPALAPGQSAIIATRISVSNGKCPKDKDRLQVMVQGEYSGRSVSSSSFSMPAIRCRRRGQSFVFTFIDVDGSLQHAAAVAPQSPKACATSGCPVVLTLHGTSITASDSADSYKVKLPGDADYRFGVKDAWLLAPTRGGAHNWEGPGLATAFAALAALPAVSKRINAPAADVDRVIFAGHSMGGHGAWLLAIGARDAALGLVTSASWLRKDRYADSNKPFLHDVATPHVDTALQALLKAAEVEFDVEEHAGMLAGGLQILARVGGQDKTVHPWFSRRMIRNLLSSGATMQEVTLTEVYGKEHWWWDTDKPNDGGAVNDKQMRDFYEVCIHRRSGPSGLPAEWRLVLFNPATSGTKGGARVLQQEVPHRRTEVAVRVVKSGNVLIQVRTSNVRRLAWATPAIQDISKQHRVDLRGCKSDCIIKLDGQDFEVKATATQLTWCHVNFRWEFCGDDADFLKVQRSPQTLGPMRQLFSAPSCAVIGDGDEAAEHSAVFVANLQVMTGYSQLHILTASSVVGKDGVLTVPRFCKHLLVVGTPESNPMVPTLLQRRPEIGYVPPIKVNSATELSLGPCTWSGDELAAVALLPWWPSGTSSGPSLALLATGTSPQVAAKALAVLATPTIPPMTRQPLTHLLPDYVVLDLPEVRLTGPGGFLAAGFWSHRWELEPRASWERYCHRGQHMLDGAERSSREEL